MRESFESITCGLEGIDEKPEQKSGSIFGSMTSSIGKILSPMKEKDDDTRAQERTGVEEQVEVTVK